VGSFLLAVIDSFQQKLPATHKKSFARLLTASS